MTYLELLESMDMQLQNPKHTRDEMIDKIIDISNRLWANVHTDISRADFIKDIMLKSEIFFDTTPAAVVEEMCYLTYDVRLQASD